MRPYVAKSYFETYKSYDHMQKISPMSQKDIEILNLAKFFRYKGPLLDLVLFFLGPCPPVGIFDTFPN